MPSVLKLTLVALSALSFNAFATGGGDKQSQPYSPVQNSDDVPGAPRGNAASTGITNEDLRQSEEGSADLGPSDPSRKKVPQDNRQTGSMNEAQKRRLQRVKKTGASFKPSPSSAQSQPHSNKSDPSFQNPIQGPNTDQPSGDHH
jgi:hypothetical protein